MENNAVPAAQSDVFTTTTCYRCSEKFNTLTQSSDCPHRVFSDAAPPAVGINVEFPFPYPCNIPGHDPDVPSTPTQQCIECKRYFCQTCMSDLSDGRACRKCVNLDQMPVSEKPLVDMEGVHHNGRELTPDLQSTGFKTMAREISEMSQGDLERHILVWKDKIKELEQLKDRYVIKKLHAETELAEREAAELRKLRGVKLAGGGMKIEADGTKRKMTLSEKASNIGEQLAAMTANTPEAAEANIKKLEEMLAAIKAAKVKK